MTANFEVIGFHVPYSANAMFIETKFLSHNGSLNCSKNNSKKLEIKINLPFWLLASERKYFF